MRSLAFLSLTALVLVVGTQREAAACASHGVSPVVKVPNQKQPPAPVEPVRILVVGVDMGHRFLKTLANIGHTVDVAADVEEAQTLTELHRYDVAVAPVPQTRMLLTNLAIATVVPVSDDAEEAADFTFVLPASADALRDQIHILHHALDHRPRRRGA